MPDWVALVKRHINSSSRVKIILSVTNDQVYFLSQVLKLHGAMQTLSKSCIAFGQWTNQQERNAMRLRESGRLIISIWDLKLPSVNFQKAFSKLSWQVSEGCLYTSKKPLEVPQPWLFGFILVKSPCELLSLSVVDFDQKNALPGPIFETFLSKYHTSFC